MRRHLVGVVSDTVRPAKSLPPDGGGRFSEHGRAAIGSSAAPLGHLRPLERLLRPPSGLQPGVQVAMRSSPAAPS